MRWSAVTVLSVPRKPPLIASVPRGHFTVADGSAAPFTPIRLVFSRMAPIALPGRTRVPRELRLQRQGPSWAGFRTSCSPSACLRADHNRGRSVLRGILRHPRQKRVLAALARKHVAPQRRRVVGEQLLG